HAICKDLTQTVWQWISMLVIALCYLLIQFLLPVPGCPTGYLGPGGYDVIPLSSVLIMWLGALMKGSGLSVPVELMDISTDCCWVILTFMETPLASLSTDVAHLIL